MNTVKAILCFIFCGLAFGHEIANPTQYVTHSFTITGLVKKQLNLTPADLKQYPSQTINDFTIISKKGARKIKSIKGVRLDDLLNKAGIATKAPGDTKKMYIVATATDNYKAIFSWNEVFNTPLRERILVFYEKNGAKLDEYDGEIALISTKDYLNGSRHVRWLKNIEVRKI